MMLRHTAKTCCVFLLTAMLGFAPLGHAASSKLSANQDAKRFTNVMSLIEQNYIEAVDQSTLYDNAIHGMVSRLDPHSTFLDKTAMEQLRNATTGQFAGIGIEMIPDNGLIKIISPLDNTPAFHANLKPGDYIIRIDDADVRNMSLIDIVNKIRGAKGTTVELTIIRQGQPVFEVNITRDIVKIVNIKAKLYDKNIAYIRIAQFQENTKKKLIAALKKLQKEAERTPNNSLQALILDLRNNPGGLMDSAVDVSNIFLDKNTLPNNDYITYTTTRRGVPNTEYRANRGDWFMGKPMIVLINAGSASASEIVAGALQDHARAIVMGTKSFGKGSVQTVFPLTRDSQIKLTTHLYHTPLGHQIQAQGIEPNIVVDDDLKFAKKTSGTKLDPIVEAQLNGHFEQSDKKRNIISIKLDDQGADIAEKDYQLYQALNLAEGMVLAYSQHSRR